jgi:hypothetical protein
MTKTGHHTSWIRPSAVWRATASDIVNYYTTTKQEVFWGFVAGSGYCGYAA